MSNYPPGAEHDPNAPYNQVDISDIYGDEADEKIDEEIENKDESFIEWLCDSDLLPEDFSDEDVDALIKDAGVRNDYRNYRFDDMVQGLAENEYEEREYHRSEAFERMRERRLLGEY